MEWKNTVSLSLSLSLSLLSACRGVSVRVRLEGVHIHHALVEHEPVLLRSRGDLELLGGWVLRALTHAFHYRQSSSATKTTVSGSRCPNKFCLGRVDR